MTLHPYWIGAPSGAVLIVALLALTVAAVVVGRLPDRGEKVDDEGDDAS